MTETERQRDKEDIILFQKVTVKVKVTDTQKNQYTFWSLEKFEARLEIMREIYQVNTHLYYI